MMTPAGLVLHKSVDEHLSPSRIRQIVGAYNENMARLLDQKVYELRLLLENCAVEPALSGRKLKVKCRGSVATFLKSDAFVAEGGGRQSSMSELTGHALYEGDHFLHFQLCQVRPFCSSKVLAEGSLSLSTVFHTVCVQGAAEPWHVELFSQSGRKMGSLLVQISCAVTRLRQFCGGLEALKVNKLPPRPDLILLESGGVIAYTAASLATHYAAECSAARAKLKMAFTAAREAAGQHDMEWVLGRGEDPGVDADE